MSGLDAEQLDELEELISDLLEEPWNKGKGHPRELTLREALIVASGYARNNIIAEIWAEIFDVNQSTISRYVSFLTPLIDKATAEFRPPADEAAEATRGAIALVDGTLWPCWSWAGERELWAGKYKTTGHGSLIITNLAGRITFVSEPVPGNQHDMAKLKGSECEIILKLAGGVFGDKGFIGTDYITTPVRKPKGPRVVYTRARIQQPDQLSSGAGRAGCGQLEDMADSLHRLQKAAENLLVLVSGCHWVSIHGVVVSCATRRRWRVFEPLVQVEHACGLCLRSLAWLM
jgi:hypothetical protein